MWQQPKPQPEAVGKTGGQGWSLGQHFGKIMEPKILGKRWEQQSKLKTKQKNGDACENL